MPPGVVVLWSREQPRWGCHRIPADGLTLGRDAIPWDGSLEPRHALVTADGDRIAVEDLGSPLGTTIEGRRLWPRVPMALKDRPVLALLGRTAIAVVDDVEPYEDAAPVRHGALVVAASLAPTLRALDGAANAEDHVLIVGSPVVGNELATRYAKLHGRFVRFRPGGDEPLDHLLSTRESVRTVIIDLVRSIPDYDVPALAHWLETDVRFVTLFDGERADWIPQAITQRSTRIDIPDNRFDEIPTIVHDRIASVIPGATLHASAIFGLLNRFCEMEDDDWHAAFATLIDAWRKRGGPREYSDDDVDAVWPVRR